MYFLEGKRLGLRPLMRADITVDYLNWLNDPDVNRYSRRRNFPTSEMAIEKYIKSLRDDEAVLAIHVKAENCHIGNIKYGAIDWPNRSCEIEILIGEKEQWGKGLGSEAMYLVTSHLFLSLNINRVEAKSANPAFARMVTGNLGWAQVGELRERFYLDGKYISYLWFSILRKEFQRIEEYEAPS